MDSEKRIAAVRGESCAVAGAREWRRFGADPVGGSETTQVRQHNGLNEITRVDSMPFEYDGVPGASNGNLANDGTLKYEWDALNRLKTVKRVSDDPPSERTPTTL